MHVVIKGGDDDWWPLCAVDEWGGFDDPPRSVLSEQLTADPLTCRRCKRIYEGLKQYME